jgi:hypothetical protein
VHDQARLSAPVRNLFAAKIASTMKIVSTISCATRKGGSFCVGAIAFRAGIFRNDCTTATKGGVISLVVLTVAILARYVFNLAGGASFQKRG